MSLCKNFICKLHWSGAIHYYFGNFFLRNNLPYEQNVKVCKTWDTDQLILEMRDYCGLIKAASSPKWNPAAPGTHRALVCSWDALCSLYFVHLRLHRLVVGFTPHCCFEKHALHSWRTIKKKCILLQSTGFCCSSLSLCSFLYPRTASCCSFANIFGTWLAASSVNLSIPEDIASNPNTDFLCLNWATKIGVLVELVKLPSSPQPCKSPETPLKQGFRNKRILGMLKSCTEPGSCFILRVASELNKQYLKEVQMANKYVGKNMQRL